MPFRNTRLYPMNRRRNRRICEAKGHIMVLSRENWQHLHSNSQSSSQPMSLMLELVRIHPNLAPNQLQMSHETLKTVLTTIIMPSLVKKSDARLKGTEKLMDHLEEEFLSQIKIQPDTPMQSVLPELALSPSTVNLTVS